MQEHINKIIIITTNELIKNWQLFNYIFLTWNIYLLYEMMVFHMKWLRQRSERRFWLPDKLGMCSKIQVLILFLGNFWTRTCAKRCLENIFKTNKCYISTKLIFILPISIYICHKNKPTKIEPNQYFTSAMTIT